MNAPVVVAAAVALSLALGGAARAGSWPSMTDGLEKRGGGENDAAVIVGVERYAVVASVPGAKENARDWFKYLRQVRNVPLGSTFLLLDEEATVEKLRRFTADAASRVKPGGTLWFIFVGHGAAARDGKNGVLIGFDAQQDPESLYARSFTQSELLATLGRSSAAQTVVLLDACFSGRTTSGQPILPGLQPLVVVKQPPALPKRTLLLTAGQNDQFAGPLPGSQRPAFSYLALGALRGWADRNNDGTITAQEVVDYAREAMDSVVRDRRQTPQAYGALARVTLATQAREKGPDLDKMVLEGVPTTTTSVTHPAVTFQPGLYNAHLKLAICPLDASHWTFCDGNGKGISENEFLRRFHRVTGSGELDKNIDSPPGKIQLIAVAGVTLTTLVGMIAGWVVKFPKDDTNLSIGIPMTILFGVTQFVGWPLAAHDWKGRHKLTQDAARGYVDRYNASLASPR